MKKLQVKKSFRPIPTSDGDEIFRNGIFEFNISKIVEHINANPHQFKVELVTIRIFRLFEPSCLDEPTIVSADLTKPIILAEIAPDRMNVIDGNHRVEKAFRNKVDQIPAYTLRVNDHINFLTSVEAYKEYINYWNSKICSR